jgi:hypothetical protein
MVSPQAILLALFIFFVIPAISLYAYWAITDNHDSSFYLRFFGILAGYLGFMILIGALRPNVRKRGTWMIVSFFLFLVAALCIFFSI